MMLFVAHGDVLHAFAVVKIEVFLHLRFLFAFGGLVDREFHEAVSVAHHLAHQRGVFGGNVFVVERQDVAEAHHIFIKLHPRVHLVPSDVADAMIDMLQSRLRRAERRLPFHKTRHERPGVIIALDKHVHDFAVSMDAAQDDFAMLVL